MRTRIKICGITRPDDALCAARLGADAIGLVFYKKSPRAVTIDQAATIVSGLPPFVSVVALFVDAAEDDIRAVLDKVPVDMLQFHGDETAVYCQTFDRPYIKALRMRDGLDLEQAVKTYNTARGLLLDSYQAGVPGGTGTTFNWSDVPDGLKKPIILAGGLMAGNVAEAIKTVRPYAVDVSGGVESAKGVKDGQKMAAFVSSVLQCNEKSSV